MPGLFNEKNFEELKRSVIRRNPPVKRKIQKVQEGQLVYILPGVHGTFENTMRINKNLDELSDEDAIFLSITRGPKVLEA